MKHNNSFLPTVFLGFVIAFSSCKKDDPVYQVPSINLTEVGSGNSKSVLAGSDLHLEAQIEAEASIRQIDIEIHQETEGDFKITKSYTEGKYIGVKSIVFHEHIAISGDAPTGVYHLHLIVTDKEGRSTTAESELTIDRKGAKVTNLKVGEQDERDNGFANVHRDLYLAADLAADAEITSILFSAHQEGVENGATLAEKELIGFYKKETGKLDAKVTIPIDAVVGDYHMHLIIKDADQHVVEVSRAIIVNDKPVVEGFEVGSGHGEDERTDYKGYIGTDLHIEGEVWAVINRLKTITVTIAQDVAQNPYTIVKVFNQDDFGGTILLRNYYFHKHVDLPADMPEGNYKFSFLVTDQQGITLDKKATLQLLKK